MEGIGLALVGIVGGLIGAGVQWALSEMTARTERRAVLLVDAYQNFIASTATLAAEARTGGVREAKDWAELIAAKQKIAYFAPPEVVAALAAFGRTSQVLGQPDADAAFAALLRAMRASLNLPPVAESDLLRVLFGKDA